MAIKKIVLDPAAIPQLAIAFMNRTHIEEVELVQEIGKIIEKSQDDEIQTEMLLDLLEQ
jgi:hypothetical protein